MEALLDSCATPTVNATRLPADLTLVGYAMLSRIVSRPVDRVRTMSQLLDDTPTGQLGGTTAVRVPPRTTVPPSVFGGAEVVVVVVLLVVLAVVVFGFVDVVAANTTAGAAPMNSANAAIKIRFITALNTTARPEVARFRANYAAARISGRRRRRR